MKQVKFKDIEDFCDDPALPGEVKATLQVRSGLGYQLSLSSGQNVLSVVTGRSQPFYFPSVEAALAELVDVPNLSRQITIDLSEVGPDAF
ncbi:MAG: hypothetical protein ACXWC4_05495 [Telluria sp.]